MHKTLNLNESTLRKRLLRLATVGICAVMIASGVPSGVVTTAYAKTVAAQEQEVTVKTANITFTGDSIKKSDKTFKIDASAMTDISYEVMNGPEYVSVNEQGVVTVKIDTLEGEYKIKVTAEATEEYQEAETTVTVTVTKPNPEMENVNVSWDLKPDKAVTYKTAYGAGYDEDGNLKKTMKSGKLTITDYKITDAEKEGYNKLSFNVKFKKRAKFRKKEVDRLCELEKELIGGVSYVTLVDYETGECLECENKHDVTVEFDKWKLESKKRYYGTLDNLFWQYNKSSVSVTVVYPKTYKSLCIVAGGYSMPWDAFSGEIVDTTGDDSSDDSVNGAGVASQSVLSSEDFYNGDLTFKETKSIYSTEDKKVCHAMRVK